MIKLLVFFALLGALAFGFASLADLPGHVMLQLGDTEIKVSLVVALISLLAFTLALMLLWTILRLVFRLPSIMAMANRMRRNAKGHHAVSRGLIAVGVGDSRLAQRFAGDSQRLLGNDPLALLLKAQAAQLSGDAGAAQNAFKTMLDTPETQGLGLRGLFVEAERRNDRDNARLFAEQAYRQTPDAPWANSAMLGFRAAEKDWRGALSIIDQSISRRLLDRQDGQKQRAILLTASALDLVSSQPDDALSLAQDAVRADAGLVPAAALIAKKLSAKGDFAKASRVIETAWKLNPHPDLAEAYLSVRIGDSALDRLKRARALHKLTPNAREARFAIARAGIDAREFGAAREALESLALEKASVRACLLMAELEEQESGNMGLVRSWLARASVAPRDPAWIADGVVSDHWEPCSPVTGQIGAFEWKEPPQTVESGLRARIDADRFASAPALAQPADPIEPPVLDLAAMPTPPEHETPVKGDAKDATPMGAIIPDDPGPETTPKEPRGFRFFG